MEVYGGRKSHALSAYYDNTLSGNYEVNDIIIVSWTAACCLYMAENSCMVKLDHMWDEGWREWLYVYNEGMNRRYCGRETVTLVLSGWALIV